MDRTIPKIDAGGKRYSAALRWTAWLLVCLGIPGALFCYYRSTQMQQRAAEAAFAQATQVMAEHLERDLTDCRERLEHARQLLKQEPNLEEASIRPLLEELMIDNREVGGYGWLPTDPRANPLGIGNISTEVLADGLIGLSLNRLLRSPNPHRHVDMIQLEGQRPLGQLTLVTAVYGRGGKEPAAAELQGVLLESIDVQRLVASAPHEEWPDAELTLALRADDRDQPLAECVIARRDSDVPQAQPGDTEEAAARLPAREGRRPYAQASAPLLLNGQPHTLDLSAWTPLPQSGHWESHLLPLLLLLLGTVAPAGLWRLAGQQTHLHEQLEARTAEILAIQTQLEREAQKRRSAETDLVLLGQRHEGLVADQVELSCQMQPDWVITGINEAGSRALGLPVEKIIGNPLLSFVPEPDRSQLQGCIDKWSASRAPSLGFTVRMLDAAGTPRWYRWNCRPLIDTSGGLSGIQASGFDVHELHQAQADVRRMSAMLNLSSDWVALTDARGTLLYLNEAGRRLCGWGFGGALPPTILALFPASAHVIQEMLAAYRNNAGVSRRAELVARGEARQYELSINSVEHPDYTPASEVLAWSGRDLTEQTKLGEELWQSEEQCRGILEAAHEGIWIIDNEHRTRLANPEMLDLLDCSAEEISGRDVFSYVAETDHSTLALELARCATGPRQGKIMLTMRRPSGELRQAVLSLAALRDAAGARTGTLVLVTDVTEFHETERRLRESELLYKTLVEHSRDLILLEDTSGWIIYMNGRAEGILTAELIAEYQANGRLLTQRAMELIHPDDREMMEQHHRQACEGVSGNDVYYRCIGSDGEIRWLQHSWAPVKDGPQQTKIVSVIRNVTELKHAEVALRESEERMRLGLRETGIGLWDVDVTTGEVVFINHWAEILGWPEQEIRDHISMWENLMHPADRESVLREWNDHLEGRTPSYENIHRLPDPQGNWHWVLDRGLVIERDSEGKALRAIGMHMEVTRQRMVEHQLRQFAAVIDQAAEMIAITDLDGNIEYVNAAFETLIGMTREAAIGQPIYPLLTGNAPRETYLGIWQTLCSENIWRGNLNHTRDGVAPRSIIATFSPVYDAAHTVTNYVVVQLDITREIELERRIQHMNRLSMIGQTVTGVAHQIRNIMSKVRGSLHVIDDAMLAQPELEHIWSIFKRNTEQIATLAENMLNYAQLEQLRMAPTDLNHMIHSIVDEFRLSAGQEGVQFEFEPEPALPVIIGDAIKLSDVVTNLIINGMHACNEQPAACIRLATSYDMAEQAAVITVADNGCGISPEHQKKIFNPFFTTKGHQGTGLGLAITQKTIFAHNGSITVESEPGNTVFRIMLPQSFGAMHTGQRMGAGESAGEASATKRIEVEPPSGLGNDG